MPSEANAANAAALKRQRATIKASCTRTQTYVESISTVTNLVKAQLAERKARLEGSWTEYNTIQTQLELLDASEASDRDGFENAYYTLAAKIRDLLNPPAALSHSSAPPSPSTSTTSNTSEPAFHVRLPKLNLPKFSGKYDEWFPFHDAFNSIIHANPSINNIQRLQYLRGCLSGEASDVVSSLEISDLNYEVAWTLLRERYDNKRVIVHTHIRAIVELPVMTKENGMELRQIADGATKHIHALQALKRPTDHWDDLLTYILGSKLDPITMREWQISLTGTELPTVKQLVDFITHKYQVLEATGKSTINTRGKSSVKNQAACHAALKYKCSYCNGDHSVFRCKDFLALPIPRRKSEIRNRGLCINCSRSTAHSANKCTAGSCKSCKGKHNTLLHVPADSESHREEAQGENSVKETTATVVTHAKNAENKYVMLSTAIVQVSDNKNMPRETRVLLDCGSQANFVSKQFLDTLGLKPRSLNISISGVNVAVTQSTHVVRLKIKSRLSSYSTELDCILADQVTEALPGIELRRSAFDLLRNLELADPQFYRSSGVDILIGAEAFWDLLCVGQIRASSRCPTLQKTRLGWILAGRSGNLSGSTRRTQALHAYVSNVQLHEELARFWRQEEISNQSNHTLDEAHCERHFLENVSQDTEGKFIVKLPVKEQLIGRLGNSREVALKRMLNLEKRFKRDPALKIQYSKFMEEYLSLGHMRKINALPQDDPGAFYLPHHCVYKHSERSSKIRVVFDASCKGSTGLSLNDALFTGPVVQQDLMAILLRFRTFAYVLVADVIKMYRQILVHPSQTSLQRILWRSNPEASIDTYELTTVTYGTSSASFLATRCLKYLAELHAEKYPTGSRHTQRDFYVDDLLTGANTIQEAKLVRDEIISLLGLGSFKLSKWGSNLPELLSGVSNQCNNPVKISDGTQSRILGIQWHQTTDVFLFSYEAQDDTDVISKRTILSGVARLFDPLGLLGPIVVRAKIILQELWQAGVQWDESVPQDIHSRWLDLKSKLSELTRLQVPQRVKFAVDPQLMQIHGFCDASQRAYGACVYVRTATGTDEYRTTLLCSKSRVAPLKAVTLPRLELSAAVLLAQLIKKVNDSIDLSKTQIFLWSDSTIALNWIASPSRRWSVFVSHRVGEIQRLTQLDSWRHISSSDNPADMLSRGIDPQELINAVLWWQGPTFLQLGESNWPNHEFARVEDDLPEKRGISVAVATFECSIINELLIKYSNLNKICRIIAYCLRARKSFRSAIPSIFVSPSEVSRALNVACRAVQKNAFPEEYRALSKGLPIGNCSKLLSLSPFMDKTGLLRVGGRLENSELPYDAKHPVLLPREHELTKRLIHREHIRNMHAGAQTTASAVRQRFWPLALRSTTRKVIRNCVTCFKARPTQSEAIMGSLPGGRVSVSRPFSHCGVDYAGPVILREGKRRNARNHKAYIVVFVCFSTKAVHLELVSDLTSEAFIATLTRGGREMGHTDFNVPFLQCSTLL